MVCLAILGVFLLPFAAAQLPKGWTGCKNSDPDYDTCFVNAVSTAITDLMDGSKKFGIFSLDPLRIEQLSIPRHDRPVSISLDFKPVDFIGLRDFKFTQMKNDWKTGVNCTMHVPQLSVVGDYKIDGKVLILPISGEGKCNLTFYDLDMDITLGWSEKIINGEKYHEMSKYNMKMKPKKIHWYFGNLFNGDKNLGDNMNRFLNENSFEVLEELEAPIDIGIGLVITEISNRVLSKIPANLIDMP